MFAPEELCKEFWAFVRLRAFDGTNEYMFSLALMGLDDVRIERALYLQPGDARVEGPNAYDAVGTEHVHVPVTYDTMQAALLDFLIDQIGNNHVPDFLDWLRAQSLILAMAAREPEWLRVRTPVVGEDGRWSTDNLTTHVMEIAAGPWDSLSWETYEALVRRSRLSALRWHREAALEKNS